MRNRHRSTAHRFALLVLCPGLLFLFSSSIHAQVVKVTATPQSIADAAKPATVVLHVTKPDNTAVDPTFNDQFGSVKVGDATVQHQFDAARSDITIAPPAGLAGAQKVQLLNKTGQPLGETTLQYPPRADAAAATALDRDEGRKDELMRWAWYRGVVMLLFGILLVPFVYTLYRVIRFSSSSFRNPLGFPVGSFRAMLAFTLVAYLGFYVLSSVLSISRFQPPEFLLGIVATVVGFYFGSRSNEEAGDRSGAGPARTGTVEGTVTKADKTAAVGATVVLSQVAVKKPAITDVDGKYKIENVPFGEASIVASLGGSSSDPKKVTVAATNQPVNLELKP